MKPIPNDILEQFFAVLKKLAVPVSRHADYRKWLQYFLDFKSKYPLPEIRSEQVRLFTQKLQEKKQSTEQQKQAAHALSLFFESQPPKKGVSITLTSSTTPRSSAQSSDSGDLVQASVPPPSAGKRFNEWHCLAKSKSPAWDKVIDTLAAEIKMRHYSRKTLKTYADWSRHYQRYLQNKSPEERKGGGIIFTILIFRSPSMRPHAGPISQSESHPIHSAIALQHIFCSQITIYGQYRNCSVTAT